MIFEIYSKFDKGDFVRLSNQKLAVIVDIKFNVFDNYYRMTYLLEFNNKERYWVEETSIQEKLEE